MRLDLLKLVHRFVIVASLVAAFAAPTSVARAQAEDEDFVPRSGAPPAQRTGGASRGISAATAASQVTLLAPAATVGLTSREQPAVYWTLSAPTDKAIEVAINDPKNLAKPVFETTLKGPHKAGLHKLDLSTAKQDGKPVKLSPGVKYDVVVEVAASANAASANPNATCKIMRVEPKDVPADAAKEKDKAKLASIYGKQGIWFDYIDALNGAIEANPKDASLVERRAKALAAQRITWKADADAVKGGARR